ncbi:hypothetical protein COT50_00785 [candidate division WWE3 bacterium CG08_land_8_20_14_0_20_41_10]|uniref:Mannosyl-glycoprotein endo-beta-N-acetylglucosamidase-like domain-containing protein n=1 Tax=candidate division WWE3 bacterium CG08_land_8_20_14_0_20_41_10 TaxID=1975085 RepID=A0A2H0XCH1_UNCKA|nr:MAG: hypothetical protein COT50_00785 [candidate division WWE3 bacterium CG08_land_8_20_14_0_20_41_10]
MIYKMTAPFIWLGLVWIITIGSIVGFVYATPFTNDAKNPQVFGAKTLRLPETQFETTQIDARVLKIEKVFARFNCPLTGNSEFIVQKADEHSIPYWLIPAVSFQESGCGKKTPNVAGLEESYNAWGYGVWGKNIKTFSSWEAGISAVSKYFGANFFTKGITDPCEIMKIYTPPSKGSWCEGVKYFADLIENFESE